jgi:predicted metal-dependent phosphoesterase TrpH
MASLIDLHTHTSYSSACAHMTAEELIEAAIEAGLDGVAVTEHLVVEGAEVAQEIASRMYGFSVYRGVEASATIFGDVLVYGCYRDFEPRTPWEILRRTVTECGGVLIPAHPFRGWDHYALWRYLKTLGLPLDERLAREPWMRGLAAIEVLNGNLRREENAKAAKLAVLLGLPGIGGSDAHTPGEVGCTATWFPDPIATDAQLVAALKRGGYRAVDRRRMRT